MNSLKWINQRRELLGAATEGPWAPWLDQDGASHMDGLLMVGNAAAVIPEGETWIEGVEVNPVAHVYTPEDRALIADARTSLPLALEALEAVLGEASALEAMADEGLLANDLSEATARLAARGIRHAIESVIRGES